MAIATGTLAACVAGPTYQAPAPAALAVPEKWHAQLPHAGRTAVLAQWWTQFNDPILPALVLAAQSGSPTLAQAEARVRQARAALSTAEAGLLPSLTGNASLTRSNGTGTSSIPGTGDVQTLSAGGFSGNWDIDLFGANRRGVEGSVARAGASEAGWHDARVGLAAEVANAYVALRQCEALLIQNESDLASRTETQRLTSQRVATGFAAPADAMRTEASVADGVNALHYQKGLCASSLNQLVALTGLSHAELDVRLAPARAAIPVPEETAAVPIPAVALSQRPDVAAAERLLAAASADIGVAMANRLPRLSLLGTISWNRLQIGEMNNNSSTWSFGPGLSLPLFDGGNGATQVRASRARYDEALAGYRLAVRRAVQEVEDALVRVDVAARRQHSLEVVDARYQRYFEAKQTQYKLGAASLLELEDARRLTIAGKQSLAAVRLERAQAWIALYKAVGGGWQAGAPAAAGNTGPFPTDSAFAKQDQQ